LNAPPLAIGPVTRNMGLVTAFRALASGVARSAPTAGIRTGLGPLTGTRLGR